MHLPHKQKQNYEQKNTVTACMIPTGCGYGYSQFGIGIQFWRTRDNLDSKLHGPNWLGYGYSQFGTTNRSSV